MTRLTARSPCATPPGPAAAAELDDSPASTLPPLPRHPRELLRALGHPGEPRLANQRALDLTAQPRRAGPPPPAHRLALINPLGACLIGDMRSGTGRRATSYTCLVEHRYAVATRRRLERFAYEGQHVLGGEGRRAVADEGGGGRVRARRNPLQCHLPRRRHRHRDVGGGGPDALSRHTALIEANPLRRAGYFPPTILTTGTRDKLLSDTARFHRALRAAGIHAELHVWEAFGHAGFLGMAPEDAERNQ